MDLVVLLAHEEQRSLRGQQKQCRCKKASATRNEHREPLALRPVTDLVVVLQADHMDGSRQPLGGRATRPASPEIERLALEDESFVQGLHDLLGMAEVLIVASALASEKGVDGVVEVVTPQRIQTVAALRCRANDLRLI